MVNQSGLSLVAMGEVDLSTNGRWNGLIEEPSRLCVHSH